MGYFIQDAVAVSARPPEAHTRFREPSGDGLRYYIPGLGRWLNRDPIGELGGIAQYAIVENAVPNRWDYLGQAFSLDTPANCLKCMAVGAALDYWKDYGNPMNSFYLWLWLSGAGGAYTVPWAQFDPYGGPSLDQGMSEMAPLVETWCDNLGPNEHVTKPYTLPQKVTTFWTFMMFTYSIDHHMTITVWKKVLDSVPEGSVCACSATIVDKAVATDTVDFWKTQPGVEKKWFYAPPIVFSDDLVAECFPKGKSFTLEATTTKMKTMHTKLKPCCKK